MSGTQLDALFISSRIISAMKIVEERGLMVTWILLTPKVHSVLGKPEMFDMARGSVSTKNMVLSDPEFHACVPINFS